MTAAQAKCIAERIDAEFAALENTLRDTGCRSPGLAIPLWRYEQIKAEVLGEDDVAPATKLAIP